MRLDHLKANSQTRNGRAIVSARSPGLSNRAQASPLPTEFPAEHEAMGSLSIESDSARGELPLVQRPAMKKFCGGQIDTHQRFHRALRAPHPDPAAPAFLHYSALRSREN